MDILELFKSQLSTSVMERLGSAVGLDAAQAQRVGQAVLPTQVAALREKASTQAGAQQLLDLAAQLPAEGTQEPLGTPAGLEQVRQSGTALLPQLLGSGMDGQLSQVAAQTGASSSGVQGMMQMMLPLVLGVVSQQASKLGLNAGSLGSLFSGAAGGPGTGLGAGLGAAATGLGAAAVGLGGAAVAGLGNAGAGLGGMAGKVGEEVTGAASSLTTGLDTPGLSKGAGNAAAGLGGAAAAIGGAAAGLGSAAAGLGSAASGVGTGLGTGLGGAAGTLGGAVGDGVATVGAGAGLGGGVVHTNPALGGRRGLGWLWMLPLLLLVLLGGCFLLRGKPATAPFAVTEPANGSAVSGAFVVKGTGTAGHEVTVSENGQPVGKATVNAEGIFSADVPAPSAGEHTYALAESGGSEALSLSVKAAGTAATTPAGAGDGMAGMGAFAVTMPAAGADLPAGAFDLKGTGKAGEELEIFEDGVSLGKATVGADGTWSLNVPSPATGAHTYTVKGPGGAELGSFKTTIAAAAASTADCTKDFSLSIKDGQSVAQPFRFGGVGSGKSYTVTIMRGERKIGSKVLPLDATCGYSYTSKPGAGTVTYTVAQTGSADMASKVTLSVK